jgi:hypothetical protein
MMIGHTPYDAEAVFEASSAGPGVLSGGFAEDALRGAGCFAVAGEISRLLGARQYKTVSGALGTFDARGYWAAAFPQIQPPRSSCIIT